ncbi:MAG: GIY-YIG nuclease family protein [Bacilli bacterium]|nr:GIY-YIG nuclease family protein [Bacilli bacterium]MBQ8218743.1 GIY-YIG nuclease family protein [Bacilli bacterium]
MKIYNNMSHIGEEKLDDNQYYIYVIENDAGHIKVGITKNISQRVISLSGSNGGGNKPIRCAVSESTYLRTIEKTVHNHYDRYRVSNTEWFKNITFEEVVEFIDNIFNSSSYTKCNELRKINGYKHRGE